MQRNQRDKLLRLRRPEVSTFLEDHPDILWVDQSENERYLEASRTLVNLATDEKNLFRYALLGFTSFVLDFQNIDC